MIGIQECAIATVFCIFVFASFSGNLTLIGQEILAEIIFARSFDPDQ